MLNRKTSCSTTLVVNRSIGLIAAATFVWLLLSGCSSEVKAPEPVVLSGPTMGTQFHIKYFLPASVTVSAEAIQGEIEARLAAVNQRMSTYLEDSELNRFNAAETGRWFAVSEDTAQVVSLALEISRDTEGAFDVTVASLVDLWGFGPTHREAEPPAAEQISTELAKVGYGSLQARLTPPALRKETALTLDLSAIAKGYAVDLVAEYLGQVGIESYMVEVGGEIVARGHKPDGESWRIAVESPVVSQREVQRVIELSDIAVATSGDYRNYFEKNGVRYSHTIDPITGYPITHNLASVTVLAKTCARADALATALNVMGPERALAFANAHELPVLLIVKEGNSFRELSSDAFAGWLN